MRLRGIGIFSFFDTSVLSISGVLARCTGLCYDLRIYNPYKVTIFIFFVHEFLFWDSFDRMLLRLNDMRERGSIIAAKVKNMQNKIFLEILVSKNLIYVLYFVRFVVLWYKFCSNRKPKRRVQLCFIR